MGSAGGDLVQSASPVLVILGKVSTGAIWIPGSYTVHWLTAATRGTRLVVVGVRAAISIVGSAGGDLVESASSVLVIEGSVLACSIWIPCSYTVHWLTATTRRTRLVVVGITTTKSIVGSAGGDLVVSASPVLVILRIMKA